MACVGGRGRGGGGTLVHVHEKFINCRGSPQRGSGKPPSLGRFSFVCT